jgi:hypothetical protein
MSQPNDLIFIRRGVTKSGIPYTVIRYPTGQIVRFACYEALRQQSANDLAVSNRERVAALPLRADLRQSKGSVSYVRRGLKLVQ